jgi:hypothetical protein
MIQTIHHNNVASISEVRLRTGARHRMTHIAIQEALHGKVVEWMEHVTDEEYLAGPARQ